jgi:uncharacterized protein
MKSDVNSSSTPFVKKFKAGKNHCIYDINTNQFLQVNQIMYDILDDFGALELDAIIAKYSHLHSKSDIRENLNFIRQMREKHNLFSSHRPKITSTVDSVESVKKIIGNGKQQIILELTNDCNQRCKYCITSGKYSTIPPRNRKKMTFKIAKQAIDFFLKEDGLRDSNKKAITFYGGEPLLEFVLMKQVVRYVKSRKCGNDYTFSFTTNGTLLKGQEVLRFLVENDVHLLISLDGPAVINDRYRVFRNGRGTFNAVLRNLERIRKKEPEYYKKNLSFSIVIAPPYELGTIDKFFFQQEQYKDIINRLSISFVDTSGTTFIEDEHQENHIEDLKKQLSQLLTRYKKGVTNGTYEGLSLEKNLFLKDFYDIAFREMSRLPDKITAKGTCIPGQRRLFVNTEGDFYMCEKVGSNYKIGDIETGINYKAVYDFLIKYNHFFSDCSDCWAVRLCSKCFDTIRNGESFCEERKVRFCDSKKNEIEKYLSIYSDIIENSPDAFNVFREISVS